MSGRLFESASTPTCGKPTASSLTRLPSPTPGQTARSLKLEANRHVVEEGSPSCARMHKAEPRLVQIRFFPKPIWTAKRECFSQDARVRAPKASPDRRSTLFRARNSAPPAGPQFGQHRMGRANLLFSSDGWTRGIKDLACPIAFVPRQFGQLWPPACPSERSSDFFYVACPSFARMHKAEPYATLLHDR